MTADDQLLLGFYGDDFTGSTDALESLATHGVRTILFTDPPTADQLAQYSHLEAFGVAGLTRSLSPQEMESVLPSAFHSLRASGALIIHYKVCSTFDSSPTIGSIGKVIDLAADIFRREIIPVVPAAPALGRYCVFGNLFARCGAESEPYRLDRHPSMSKHPVTPMDEADLVRHLAKQTAKQISLFDLLMLRQTPGEVRNRLNTLINGGADIVLFDALDESDLAVIGSLLSAKADRTHPLFVVGSSGVESALCAAWKREPIDFPPVQHAGPILAVCGSCSPVTAGQIRWATGNGFTEIALDAEQINEAAIAAAIASALKSFQQKRSVVLHTAGESRHVPGAKHSIANALATIVRKVVCAVNIKRMLVAGGDTSSHLARDLGIISVEMIGQLTRGSPLCKTRAPGSPADGLEVTFKGGQIGKQDFFGLVEHGSAAHS